MSFLIDYITNNNEEAASAVEEDRLTQLRLKRRLSKAINSRIEFDLRQEDFNDHAAKQIDELVLTEPNSYSCYQIIINSLEDYFAAAASTSNNSRSPALTANFLSSVYLDRLERAFTTATASDPSELAIHRRELYCLLRFYLLRAQPQPTAELRLTPALQSIYFSGGHERLTTFLDETICDEFILDLPFYIVACYQDLGFMLPEGLETLVVDDTSFLNESEEHDPAALKMRELMEAMRTEEEDECQTQSTVVSQSSRVAAQLQSHRVIPQTPEKKYIQKERSNKHPDEIVPRTPISQLRKGAATGRWQNLLARSDSQPRSINSQSRTFNSSQQSLKAANTRGTRKRPSSQAISDVLPVMKRLKMHSQPASPTRKIYQIFLNFVL